MRTIDFKNAIFAIVLVVLLAGIGRSIFNATALATGRNAETATTSELADVTPCAKALLTEKIVGAPSRTAPITRGELEEAERSCREGLARKIAKRDADAALLAEQKNVLGMADTRSE